ncbi:ABC transporter permease subunit [Candidatus Amarobacter glycogenicus]|uniref:ABC transporter permease subunit n=2 Tax=Candidatus Amarobacter glycogenicus TaxID=3140699 RepID=UPI003134E54F|nr:ABC transporter permease subunit [Dehalococcoidia bacterium]
MTAFPIAPPVRALVRKELREYRHHRMIVLTATILPIVFLILPMANLALFDPDRSVGGTNLAVGQAMFCFFLSPVIIPATMAAFAVIGERDQGTLEPLLTLPLTDRQFLAGKVIAILIPTISASFTIYTAYMLFVLLAVHGPVREPVLDWTWPMGFVLLAPALAAFSTLVGMAFSARAKDIRVAEHLSGLVLLPAMLPVMLVVTRTIPATPVTWLVFVTAIVVLDFLLWRMALRAFDRERAISAV